MKYRFLTLFVLLLLAGCGSANPVAAPPVPGAAVEAEKPPEAAPEPREAVLESPEAVPEPFSLTLTAPDEVTVTADSPALLLECALSCGGEGPNTGLLEVLLDGAQVLQKTVPLETGPLSVPLSFEFTRYMEKTQSSVVCRVSGGGFAAEAETTVSLRNHSDEVYAKASGEALPYRIEVVKNHNVIIVYGMDGDRQYTKAVKTFLCSTGAWTPLGEFRATTRFPGFRALFANAQHTAYCYGQYAIEFSGNYLFHSVPYFTPDKADLEFEEYNKLGSEASLGCVRLAAGDVKWLYDNCPYGTPVSIVNREELGVERPENFYIDLCSPIRNWDPTDPDPENPWHAISGT